MDWIMVETLTELDALVGRYITGEAPTIHWEDSYAHMRFESAGEALEALPAAAPATAEVPGAAPQAPAQAGDKSAEVATPLADPLPQPR